MGKLFALIAALALMGCAGESVDEIVSYTPEHFRDTAKITDDQLETTAIITTEDGRHQVVNYDVDGWACKSYLRAFIDKRSGATSYQLYADITYYDDRRIYSTINYFSLKGVQSAPLIRIAHNTDPCHKADCLHTEDVGFNMPDSMVREIAATYAPHAKNGWLFKLKGKVIGTDIEGVVMPSEAAGLLMAVQAYKASLHR